MPKRNWPLYIGIALALVFAVLAVFGPALAPQDPLETNLYLKVGRRIHMVPVAPFVTPGYWLGTDEGGRDVLSRILWGIRPTLVICVVVALARLVVGVVIGLAAGWLRGATERVVDAVGSIGVGLPALVLAIALISFLGVERGVVSFVISLTLVGWIEVANLVKAQTLTVVQAPYVESARALGVGPFGVVRRHLLPQLRPLLPVLLAFELSAALLLLTELGFLGIFIGGGTTYQFDTGGVAAIPVLTADQPELAQQISRFWTKFYRVPWEFIAVGVVIFAQIVAFNLVGEGLRRHLDVTQPRRRRWLRVPERVLDRVPQLGWRWIPVGATVAALTFGGWWYGRASAEPSEQPQAVASAASSTTSAAPSVPQFSTNPLPAAQLTALDLEALVQEPGLLPENITIGQVSERVPVQFSDVPVPAQARNFNLKASGVSAGNIVVLLYGSTEERDRAAQTMADVVEDQVVPFGTAPSPPAPRQPDATPVAGDQSYTFGLLPPNTSLEQTPFPVGPQQVIFARCGAVVQVRPAGASGFTVSDQLDEGLMAMVKTLDERLTPAVCQEKRAPAAQASSTASLGVAPRSADELRALDVEALLVQPGLLPERVTTSQVLKRVPVQFHTVPEPVQAWNFNLKEASVSAGNIVVLLYAFAEDRDRAAPIVQAVTIESLPVFGPGGPAPSSGPAPAIGWWVDVRCGAVMQVWLRRSMGTSVQADAFALGQALEAQLAPLVCQPS
jgi:ABC-type dipeptide/oligopeptide/nickel transport system permease subunit